MVRSRRGTIEIKSAAAASVRCTARFDDPSLSPHPPERVRDSSELREAPARPASVWVAACLGCFPVDDFVFRLVASSVRRDAGLVFLVRVSW